jgi:hypothetical protein
MIEITRLTKVGGPLTKRISLSPDGTLKSDGSACLMSRGDAQRVRLDDPLRQGAALIQSLKSHEAIALGRMRPDLPDQVRVVTKDRLAALNGRTPPDTIARIGVYISYAGGCRWRPESAYKRRRAKYWHRICRNPPEQKDWTVSPLSTPLAARGGGRRPAFTGG